MRTRYDAVVVGGGHNGLTAAAYLAGAGRSVLVLERDDVAGGAARSAEVFPGYGARLSKYAYLVSLLPELIVDELGLDLTLAPRRFSSYTPAGDGGILVCDNDAVRTQADLGDDATAWSDLHAMTRAVAERVFPTLTEPLRSADDLRRHVGDDEAWKALFERPLGDLLEERLTSDVVRGIVLTDALIGTFTSANDPSLLANRCYLYHVIGRRTGRWDVPLGGIGSVSDGLAAAARSSGAEIETDAEVVAVETDDTTATVRIADGRTVEAGQVLANVAPTVLARLLGERSKAPAPEGSQLKINMLLARLPRLCDASVTSEQAFTGTFHINEGYDQLERAYRRAAAGQMPELPPCEVYCHSLTDPSILSPSLRAAGVHTLTLFGLHMPARLFRNDPVASLARAREATMASVNSVLAEPVEDCLLDPSTIEVMGPLEIEANLGMPGGHIFHGDLQWPFAERAADVGRWGVETSHANVFVCGAGARRGGGVSGIPGRNAAMAALAATSRPLA
jgi:phytoene dehydrogenase-like protein